MGALSNLPIPFLVLSFLTILSALYVVTSKNPVHSVLALIFTFFTISAHYVLLNAQFLAIVNLMVYAGAIMVLFLFVLMLLNLNKDKKVLNHVQGKNGYIREGLNTHFDNHSCLIPLNSDICWGVITISK